MQIEMNAHFKWARYTNIEDLDVLAQIPRATLETRLWSAGHRRQAPGQETPTPTPGGQWRLYGWIAAGNAPDIALPEVELGSVTVHGVDAEAKAVWVSICGVLEVVGEVDFENPDVVHDLKLALNDCLCVTLEIPRADVLGVGGDPGALDTVFGPDGPIVVSFDDWDGLELSVLPVCAK